MSREQRRVNRRDDARSAGAGGGSVRRTPVKAPGSGGPPWAPIAIVGGAIAIVALIAYLIIQAGSGGGDALSASDKAEQDDSTSLPGVFYPSQGRGHFSFGYSQDRTPTPFCEGVISSAPASASSSTPATTTTPEATSTPVPASTGTGGMKPATTPTVQTGCYASNPPSSGQHLGVQRNVDVGGGAIVNIPADPDVYPSDVHMPRESIAHILEHAGVFVGYNCAEGDSACQDVVKEMEDLVNDRIDNNDNRVVMAQYDDLPLGELAIAGWTRVYNFKYQDYDEDAASDFIGTHSCRFDPEGFCS